MSLGSDPPQPRPECVFDDDGTGLSETLEDTRDDRSFITTYTYTYRIEPRSTSFQFAHDKEKGLFTLTWPDGKIESFRDNPARQLVVEPDPETGELRPATRHGDPVYFYVCREERELA
jgi:hypothetical protein